MSVIFGACCNVTTYGCGCATWLQLERGQWVTRSWTCYGHETAAREAAG